MSDFLFKREQLAQKVEKRARTRRYRIVSKVNGSWLPLWTYGCKVCIHPPLTDEPRIALEVDDLVNVTRWRKYWLFGEKILKVENTNGVKNGDLKAVKNIRGWFPRKAAELIHEDDFEDEDEEAEKKIK